MCKLFGPTYGRAATMEASVNSFIKTEIFPCKNTHSKIMKSHAMEWTNLEINVLMGKAMKFQDREHQTFLSTSQWWKIHKASKRPTHSSSNSKMFCSHRLSKTISSESHKAIKSFSLQEAVAGVSREENLVAVKETSNEMAVWYKE